jgi:hypothetical protein
MKLTPWFPPDVNPVRTGPYKIKKDCPSAWYRYWDGENWYVGATTPDAATHWPRSRLTDSLKRPWRGIAEEPK